MSPMPFEFTKLNSAQILALPRDQSVFFFPVGPLEDHGPHLPVGLDLREAERLCRLAAERLEREKAGWVGIVMPAAPLGIDSTTTHLAITVRPHVLRDWLVDACRSMMRLKFRHFVCFTGHLGPKQLTAIEEAGKMISRTPILHWARWLVSLGQGAVTSRTTLVSACSAIITPQVVRKSPFWLDSIEHGGKRDTSVGLALAMDQVSSGYKSLVPAGRKKSIWDRWMARVQGSLSGYWGTPSEATVGHGETVMAGTMDEVFPKLRAVWEGANPNGLFRSYYSVLPPNKSFFKSWILAFAIMTMLMVWIYFNVQTMLR